MRNLQRLNLKDSEEFKGILTFLCLFILLQQIWLQISNTDLGAWWINDVITQALRWTITWIQTEPVSVMGSMVVGAHVSMNIANGCDGMDMMLMLVSALFSSTLSLKHKLLGSLCGLIFLFLINQLRLLLLFYVVQHHRDHFMFIHGILAPLLILGVTGIFYAWWLAVSNQRQNSD